MPAEPEQRRHRVRVRYVVEQNVEVEAGDPVQARKLARDTSNWTTAVAPPHTVFRRFSPS